MLIRDVIFQTQYQTEIDFVCVFTGDLSEEATTTEPGEPTAEGEEEAPPAPKVIEDEGRIVSVMIHRTDKLKTDFYTAHPLVRVSVVDELTGTHLKKQTRFGLVFTGI